MNARCIETIETSILISSAEVSVADQEASDECCSACLKPIAGYQRQRELK